MDIKLQPIFGSQLILQSTNCARCEQLASSSDSCGRSPDFQLARVSSNDGHWTPMNVLHGIL